MSTFTKLTFPCEQARRGLKSSRPIRTRDMDIAKVVLSNFFERLRLTLLMLITILKLCLSPSRMSSSTSIETPRNAYRICSMAFYTDLRCSKISQKTRSTLEVAMHLYVLMIASENYCNFTFNKNIHNHKLYVNIRVYTANKACLAKKLTLDKVLGSRISSRYNYISRYFCEMFRDMPSSRAICLTANISFFIAGFNIQLLDVMQFKCIPNYGVLSARQVYNSCDPLN